MCVWHTGNGVVTFSEALLNNMIIRMMSVSLCSLHYGRVKADGALGLSNCSRQLSFAVRRPEQICSTSRRDTDLQPASNTNEHLSVRQLSVVTLTTRSGECCSIVQCSQQTSTWLLFSPFFFFFFQMNQTLFFPHLVKTPVFVSYYCYYYYQQPPFLVCHSVLNIEFIQHSCVFIKEYVTSVK